MRESLKKRERVSTKAATKYHSQVTLPVTHSTLVIANYRLRDRPKFRYRTFYNFRYPPTFRHASLPKFWFVMLGNGNFLNIILNINIKLIVFKHCKNINFRF